MSKQTPQEPYKFLDYYKPQDEAIFFGRKRETRILVADVIINRLVVLFAKTGTGKTSLINAGVRPRLKDRGYETFFIRVSKDPDASARDVLTGENPELRDIATLPLDGFLQAAAKRLKKPIVLFFDQFEEFFIYIYGRERARAQQFISAITELYKNEKSNVHIVLSLREDFLAYMDAFRDKLPAILHNDSNLRLLWFDEQQAREAIYKPADKFGVKIEKALEDQLIADLARDAIVEPQPPGGGGGGGNWPTGATAEDEEIRIEPARLQIVCDTLWKKKPADHKSITLADYITLGKSDYLKSGQQGAAGNIARQILYRRLVEVFEQIQDKQQLDILEKLLPKLRIEQTKHVYEVSSLAKDLQESPSSLQTLLQTLAASGLVRLQKIRDDIDVVELAHDYLVSHLTDLQEEVRKILPRRILKSALANYQNQKKLVPPDDLRIISEKIHLIDFSREQAEIFFRSALKSGRYIDLWFEHASAKGVKVWEILDEGIRGDDPQQHSYIKKLLVQLQTPEVFDFLKRTASVEYLRPRVEGALEWLAESDAPDVASQAKKIIDGLPRPTVTGSGASETTTPRVRGVKDKSRLISTPTSGPKPPYGELSDLLAQGQVVPILGAGVNFGMRSPNIKWDEKSPFPPSNTELSKYLGRLSSFPAADENDFDDLARVASYFAYTSARRRLSDRLREVFNKDFEPGPLHRYLAGLSKPMLIITTCYDDMLERAFRESGRPFDLVVSPTERKDFSSAAVLWWKHQQSEVEIVPANQLFIDLKGTTVIYKLFGSVDRLTNQQDNFVITEEDYLDFFGRMVNQTAIPAQFMKALTARSRLFLGYGLQDWPRRMLLNQLRSLDRSKMVDGEDEAPRSWAIQYRPSPLETELWNVRSIKIYDVDLNEFARGLQEGY